MSTAEWITLVSILAGVAVAAGGLLARVSALAERVRSLESGNVDGKRRLGEIEKTMGIVEYKLWGRRHVQAIPVEAGEKENT